MPSCPCGLTDKDVDAVVVGWLLALRALVSVVSRFGLTRLVRMFGRKPLLRRDGNRAP